MAFDIHSNFGYGTIATAPSPATTGTTVVLGTATFANFSDPGTVGYNMVVWPQGTIPLSNNSEIVRVVTKGTNGTLNIVREQESTTARTIEAGDQCGVAITKKVITDIEDRIGSDSWVIGEIANETPNGTLTAFTVDNDFLPNSTMVFRDGQLMRLGTAYDYTEGTAGTITFSTAPATSSNIVVTYRKNLDPNGNADTLDGYHASKTPVEGEIPVLSNTANWLRDSIYRQAIINGGCQVAQMAAVNLTNGKLYGAVDMFYAKGAGTAVSAGTISQATNSNASNSGLALRLAGVTLTGTGIVYAYTFIEAKNALLYKNKTASFGVVVYHDVGSAKNFTIKINKANAADNFSAVTNIATDTAQSVENATATRLILENVSLGDCSNGIEIEVYCESGAITTKNFDFAEWQFNEGAVVLPFAQKSILEELYECMRYIQTSYPYGVVVGSADGYLEMVASINAVTTSVLGPLMFRVSMRTTPTVIFYASDSNVGAGTAARVRDGVAGGLKTVTDYTSNAVGIVKTVVSSVTVGSLYTFNYVAFARPVLV